MLSDAHEDIIDDVRVCVAEYNKRFDTNFGNCIGGMEHMCAAIIAPELKGVRLVADWYIFPNDGHSVMPLEVGTMKPGKWNQFNDAKDGKPIRVLRIDFDGTVWYLNPRNTSFEKEFVSLLNDSKYRV